MIFQTTPDGSSTPLSRMYITNAGLVYRNDNSEHFDTTSDEKFKKDIQPITDALNVVKHLKPMTFRWIDTGKSAAGFVAQDYQRVFPEDVREHQDEKGNTYLGMNEDRLHSYLVAAVQELAARLEKLEAR